MRFRQFLLENNSDLKSFEQELQKKYGLTHLRLYKKGNDLILDMIVVPKDKRKQGIGSKVLEDITHYADVNGLRILLTTAVKDDYHGTTSGTRLKAFYKKFGFVENKGRNKDFTTTHNMIRDPKKKVLKESEEQTHLGYKIVNFDGKEAYSIADKKVKYSLKKNDIHAGNIYLGTSKKYATEYYSTDSDDPEDPEELLLTYQFSPSDIKKGNIEDKDYMTGGSEIIVSKAKLVGVYNITKKKTLVESEERIPDSIKVNGEKRPTKNNLGEYIYDNLDDIISFWKWFGDSKIVDSNGRPILATHSTNNKFSEFDTEKTSSGAAWGKGVYFSLDKKWSNGKFTKHCYLKSLSPLVGNKITKEDRAKLSKYVGREVETLPILTLEKRGGDLISGLVLAGFDSFIGDGPGSTGLHIVIPNKNQIREVKETEKSVNESEELSESISPKKPDKVLTKSKIKNSGTNTAHKIRYKEFTTKNNNKVYVQFKDLSDNGIKIDFEVNDSFDDSNLNDYDVLRNVLYVVLKEVNAKKYNLIELNPKHRSDSNRNNKHIRFDLFRKLVNKYLQDYSEYYVDRTNFGDSDLIILKRKENAK